MQKINLTFRTWKGEALQVLEDETPVGVIEFTGTEWIIGLGSHSKCRAGWHRTFHTAAEAAAWIVGSLAFPNGDPNERAAS